MQAVVNILRVRPYSVIFKRLQEKLRTSDSYSLSLAVSRVTTVKNFMDSWSGSLYWVEIQ